MKAISGKMVAALLIVSVVSLLMMDFADARRGGRGGGRSMSRGGPAASGSFNRSRARPQSSPSQRDSNRGGAGQRQGDRQDRGGQRQDNRDDRQDNRQDRGDQRQDNRNDRQDNRNDRQDNRDDRQDNRREHFDDRNEWYEDRWRRRAFVTAASWRSMNCNYTTVVSNGITFYDCSGVRYERVYRGSQVTYIIVN